MKNKAELPGGHKYFLEAYKGIRFQHGGVGNSDVERILMEEGYQPIRFPEGRRFWITLKRFQAMNRWLRCIPDGAEIVCQFPVYPRMYRLMMNKLSGRNIRLVILIADIDGLKTGNKAMLEEEIKLLKTAKYFIVHNSNMEAWLRQYIPGAITSQLGPFDFLAAPASVTRTKSRDICFAGNLAKSGFLVHLAGIPDLNFHLYGKGITTDMLSQDNCRYHGIFEPAVMPGIIKGSFGLVWDGESVSGPSGSLGEYMHYIFHHKVSLYILAGMPIIAPVFAGSAEYIRSEGIGWLVRSLEEIPDLVNKITEEEYRQVIERMRPLAAEISTGRHLKSALRILD